MGRVCDVCCLVWPMSHGAAQGQEDVQELGDRGLVGEATWAGKAQAAPPSPPPAQKVGSPKRQTISGEPSRGRSPEPDPTGTEDSPLSQVNPCTPSYPSHPYNRFCESSPVPPSTPVPPATSMPPVPPTPVSPSTLKPPVPPFHPSIPFFPCSLFHPLHYMTQCYLHAVNIGARHA